mmetsp:Transcript_46744/g.99195  ORF Transcript_46744/g.99195 Transcript_46744/m.99195 type:complete len:215 (+) Transcript_46744:2016-2660(+)
MGHGRLLRGDVRRRSLLLPLRRQPALHLPQSQRREDVVRPHGKQRQGGRSERLTVLLPRRLRGQRLPPAALEVDGDRRRQVGHRGAGAGGPRRRGTVLRRGAHGVHHRRPGHFDIGIERGLAGRGHAVLSDTGADQGAVRRRGDRGGRKSHGRDHAGDRGVGRAEFGRSAGAARGAVGPQEESHGRERGTAGGVGAECGHHEDRRRHVPSALER